MAARDDFKGYVKKADERKKDVNKETGRKEEERIMHTGTIINLVGFLNIWDLRRLDSVF